MNEKDYKKGFGRGFSQLRLCDREQATKELWAAIEVNNRESFRYYLTGKIELKASKAAAVENVFYKYGITDVWGE